MAHYAKVVNGIVKEVIVAEEDFITEISKQTVGKWIQTSYNTRGGVHILDGTPLRKNYAGVGFHYDKENDAFYPPQLYPSWTLNSDTYLWEAPISKPDDSAKYHWDEDAYQADNTTGWVEVTND